MLAIDIRPATRFDLPAIVQLLQRDSIPSRPELAGPTREQNEAFDVIAAHPDNELIIAALSGEVVATLQLTFIPDLTPQGGWRAQVEGVRVQHDVRSQGIGRQLMEWVIARARERRCRLVQLTTNHARLDAQRFYERLGFTPSHTGMKLHLLPK